MIVTILLIFIILVIIAFAYDYYVHHTRAGRLLDKIPGPKGIPIAGNAFELLTSPEKIWLFFRHEAEKYYPTTKIWAFFLPVVSIRHPDDLQAILNNTKHIEKGKIYKLLHAWLNTGLLTSSGAKWHSRRKILTPTFHFNILQQFIHILLEESERMTHKLKNIGGTAEIDVIPFVSEHTLNAICETAMGTSLQSFSAAQKRYRQDIRQMSQLFIYRPWLHPDLTFALTSAGRLQKKTLKSLHGFVEKIIAKRKLYHERTNNKYLPNLANDDAMETNDDVKIHESRRKQLAMLDLLIAASQENHLSDLDIREEVDTFMFEGHDTTAIAICFILLLLAEHKNIQDRVRDEVNTVMEQFEEKLTMMALQSLSYLERCLKESLRLYPSVHFIAREAGEDLTLRDSNIIPAGTIVQLNIYDVHRDPNFWPNPNVFDPDRFLPERIQRRHPYSYLSFSAGPRNCIGQRFAMLEMKAMIASLIRNFYVEPIDYLKDMEITSDIILRPNHPLRVKFVPLENV